MARGRKKAAPLKWRAGTKHPTTGKVVGGRIMSKAERAVFKTDGKLRKGKRKADYTKAKRSAPKRRKTSRRKRNPAKGKAPIKMAASKIKISQTRKTAPKGWKSSMGPYVIVTTKGYMVKGGSFRSLAAAKKKLASLRAGGRKGLKLVKVSIPKKKTATKRKTTRKRTTTRRRNAARRKKPRKRRRSKRAGTVSKKALRGMMKRLGI